MSIPTAVKAVALLAMAATACDEAPPPTDTVIGRVSHIVDGDTFFVGDMRIRLCGIDAPAQGRPGYRHAAKFLQSMIDGKTVRCVPVGAGATCVGRSMPHSSNRLVAQCFLGGIDVADEMVREGHAKDWRRTGRGRAR